jgi:hypothetical protein
MNNSNKAENDTQDDCPPTEPRHQHGLPVQLDLAPLTYAVTIFGPLEKKVTFHGDQGQKLQVDTASFDVQKARNLIDLAEVMMSQYKHGRSPG